MQMNLSLRRIIRKLSITYLVCSAFLPSAGSASEICRALAGTKPSTISFNQALAQVSKLPLKKEEFETTEAYNARLSTALRGMTTPQLVRVPLNSEGVSYNADTQRFQIESAAFGASYEKFDNYPLYAFGNVQVDWGLNNIDVVGSQEDKPISLYNGINSYGAKVEVVKLKRFTKAIFDRKGGEGEDLFNPPLPYGEFYYKNPLVVEIPMDPNKARLLKGKMTAAVLITPKAPFYATGKYNHEPTIDDARDVNGIVQVIIADIMCAVIIDSSGVVVGARETR
jgi:hypothetical protein